MLIGDNDRIQYLHYNDAETTFKIHYMGCYKPVGKVIYF